MKNEIENIFRLTKIAYTAGQALEKVDNTEDLKTVLASVLEVWALDNEVTEQQLERLVFELLEKMREVHNEG